MAPAVAEPLATPAKAPLVDYRGMVISGPQVVVGSLVVPWGEIEASQRRNAYRMPAIIPGEPVYWRPHKDNREYIAWAVGSFDNAVKLTTMKPGSPPNIDNVYWWDHTMPDCQQKCDPKASWNNSGTFRQTEFGVMIRAFVENMQRLSTYHDVLKSLEARVAELEASAKPKK